MTSYCIECIKFLELIAFVEFIWTVPTDIEGAITDTSADLVIVGKHVIRLGAPSSSAA